MKQVTSKNQENQKSIKNYLNYILFIIVANNIILLQVTRQYF